MRRTNFGTTITWSRRVFNEKEPVGAYIVAMGIDKVWFADGTTWELETGKTN